MEKTIEVLKLILTFGEQAIELFLWVWRTATGPASEAREALLEILDSPTRKAVEKILADNRLSTANTELDAKLANFLPR